MQPRSVLVVDDSLVFRETLRMLLSTHGFSPVCTGNGQEALDYLQKNPPPHVILLDLDMPVMDGLTFLERQKEQVALASIPVLVLSVDSDLPEMVACASIAGYLKKPFLATELLEAIEALPHQR